jgi:uncharacterized protein
VHPDVMALLQVQDDDLDIYELEDRLATLRPRIEALAKEKERAMAALAQARQAVEGEERRHRDVRGRLDQYKQLEERNQSQLNAVSTAREATAATAQLDQARRMISEAQRETDAIAQRLGEMRHVVVERERAVLEMEQAQQTARASLDADQKEIESKLSERRAQREQHARGVPRNLLSRYDRIRSRKREHAIFPLRNHSCANCDTVLPLQRRSAMAGSGVTEVCEGCGVLLYARE